MNKTNENFRTNRIRNTRVGLAWILLGVRRLPKRACKSLASSLRLTNPLNSDPYLHPNPTHTPQCGGRGERRGISLRGKNYQKMKIRLEPKRACKSLASSLRLRNPLNSDPYFHRNPTHWPSFIFLQIPQRVSDPNAKNYIVSEKNLKYMIITSGEVTIVTDLISFERAPPEIKSWAPTAPFETF